MIVCRYIGRVELPNNVNVFFRPIAMMKPDTTTISEVLLLSNGFVNAPSLATKLTKFFEFMETQVSKQVHCSCNSYRMTYMYM